MKSPLCNTAVHTPPTPPIVTPFDPAGKGLKPGLGFTNSFPLSDDGDLAGSGHWSFA